MSGALKRPIDRIAYRSPEAAAALGVSERTFREWVTRGLMPAPFTIDRITLYDAAEVIAAWDAMRSGAPRRGHKEQNPYDA